MEHFLVLCVSFVISRSTFGGYFVCRLFTLPTMVEEEVTTVVADNGSGMHNAGFARDDAFRAEISSTVGRHIMPGILVGMDQKDSNSSDEVQSMRCKVSVEADEWLSNNLQIDPIIDEV